MQSHYPARFEREMGCTVAELAAWLPGAVGGRPLACTDGRAEVAIDGGRAVIEWRELPPRRIALIAMPRLAVAFRFDDVDEARRQDFMRYFDLYTQRGGG